MGVVKVVGQAKAMERDLVVLVKLCFPQLGAEDSRHVDRGWMA